MTKVTFIGQEPTKESKHIQLFKSYIDDNVIINERFGGHLFGHCELLKRNAKDGLDLISCYDKKVITTHLYLGNWNDGTTSNPETVCTVLGEDVAVKKGSPIEFIKQVNTYEGDAKVTDVPQSPKYYENILVVRYGKEGFLDLFIAYHGDITPLFTDIKDQQIFLGHLNDGFVE